MSDTVSLANAAIFKDLNDDMASTSKKSSSSHTVSLSVRAKAEASKSKLLFKKKEIELLKQEALLQEQQVIQNAQLQRRQSIVAAELSLLQEEKEAAALAAEASVLEAGSGSSAGSSVSQLLSLPEVPDKDRTAEYIAKLEDNGEDRTAEHVAKLEDNGELMKDTDLSSGSPSAEIGKFVQSLSAVFLRKDLMLNRLTSYDEDPATYLMWANSFKAVARDLGASPVEELDLLAKYLGPESSKLVIAVRKSNPTNPAKALRLLWERLANRYGSPERTEEYLKRKISDFKPVGSKEPKRLYELSDIAHEILAAKEDDTLGPLFAGYDSSAEANTLVKKLPHHLKQRWIREAVKYKEEKKVLFPPFSFLAKFLEKVAKQENDPAFTALLQGSADSGLSKNTTSTTGNRKVFSRATEVTEADKEQKVCPLHGTNHDLQHCKAFGNKSQDDKLKVLKEKGLCFRCFGHGHASKQCQSKPKCAKCGLAHQTCMHDDSRSVAAESHGGEKNEGTRVKEVVTNCTSVCATGGKSCGKVIPVMVSRGGKEFGTYAILDDQSNRSLASSCLLDQLGVVSGDKSFTLSSCGGTVSKSGRSVIGLQVSSLDGDTSFDLPEVLECSLPQNPSEIPTPETVMIHPHLESVAKFIHPLIPDQKVGLLIGRDLPQAHHVHEQIVGPPKLPFAQKLPLGWAVIGEVCLDGLHRPNSVNVFKTNIIGQNRESIFEPCENKVFVKESDEVSKLFEKTPEDEKPGFSVEDRKFLKLMETDFKKDENGRWSAPLPFREGASLPTGGRAQALGRANLLQRSLKKNPQKREHMLKFMAKILESGAAEEAPSVDAGTKTWYLPLFGVYHPKKPDKIRGVFDSSAAFEGVSLNDVLLSGPDLCNSLLGILLRFRKDTYPITADIEQMFYQFFVDQEHRDFLRFFWHKDNDFDKPLVEYRMTVHVFGNSPSPAVATYGLRKAVEHCEEEVKDYVGHNFYVDDGVTSVPRAEQAVSLVTKTKASLKENGGLNLHKIASTDREILKAFNKKDLCEELRQVDLNDTSVPLPVHGCLGLPWHLETDTFVIKPELGEAAFTRRGLLSTLNGIFDPLGFLSPVVIAGKILLRKIVPNGKAWDEPLAEVSHSDWLSWKESVESLGEIVIPRMFVPTAISQAPYCMLHIFCDASEQAVSAVAFIEVKRDADSRSELGFVMGKAKLAPTSGHTIPRLELCSAVLAVEICQVVSEHLGISPECATFYTDSKVVLGYICNETRRFHTYVSNRVDRIRRNTHPQQWKYISTDLNPADAATRGGTENLEEKVKRWLLAPSDALEVCVASAPQQEFPLVSPDDDKEIRVTSRKTEVAEGHVSISARFGRFSSWLMLVNAFTLLRQVCSRSMTRSDSEGSKTPIQSIKIEAQKNTEVFILKTVQMEAYPDEVQSLRNGHPVPKSSSLYSLSPYLDEVGLLRVGGRICKAENILGVKAVHPVILPKKHHISELLVRHFHQKVNHQGRHFTEGALRSAGYWIVGAKRLVSSEIHQCLICKRLRGVLAHQRMANLPTERVVPSAPFSHVGVDVFGPWSVLTRKTRGGAANSKRWAVVFTCLAIRAIHIEVIEEMTSSSFINALKRFVALRGPVSEFRSDRGTNFVGAAKELNFASQFVEDVSVSNFLAQNKILWTFNPPHASHMGGVWERMIGVIRGILDAMLLDARRKPLTHEVLCTLMAEVCAVVNGRPIVPVSHDSDSPFLLTPSMLLTQKVDNEVPYAEVDLKTMYQSQWKHVQVLSNIFWGKWKEEYLHSLQQRKKWQVQCRNLKENDLVLICDKQTHRNEWPMGVVTKTYPSEDGLVRSVQVKIARGDSVSVLVRPISELVLLESD